MPTRKEIQPAAHDLGDVLTQQIQRWAALAALVVMAMVVVGGCSGGGSSTGTTVSGSASTATTAGGHADAQADLLSRVPESLVRQLSCKAYCSTFASLMTTGVRGTS